MEITMKTSSNLQDVAGFDKVVAVVTEDGDS